MFPRALMVGMNHRLATLLFLLSVTLFLGSGLQRLRIDTGLDSLISATDPNRQVLARVAREFGSDNRTFVYVRDGLLWSPQKLAQLEELHHALAGLDFVQRVEDLFTLRSIRGTEGRLDTRALMPEAPDDQRAADRILDAALYNPLIVGNLLSRDGGVTALIVTLRQGLEPGYEQRVNQTLEQLVAMYRPRFDEIFQLGSPRVDAELKAALFEDLIRLAPLSAAVLVVTILLFMRSGFAAAIPLVTSALSLVWAAGLMGWMGIPINILSAMLPSLVIVIGSTEDTHMMASYIHGISRSEGQRRTVATRFTVKHVGVPLLLTVMTTAMGFAGNIFSSIGLIRDFAVVSTCAILANGLITLLLVPMMLVTFGPRKIKPFRQGDRVRGLPGLVTRLFGLIKRRHSNLVLLLTALLCALFLHQATRLQASNDPLSYFRDGRPLIRQVERMHRDLAGMKLFFVTLESDREKAFLEPRNIGKLAAIQAFLEKQEVFDRSLSLADHLALVNREFHDGDPAHFEIPATRELVAQYLLFFHRSDLEGYVSHDYRRALIPVRHNIGDSHTLNRHIQELEGVVADIAGAEMKGYVVGENLMINAAAESLLTAQVKSLVILMSVIFLIMSAMFTSLKGGGVSLVPSLIPIVLVFGAMGLLDIPLNPGTAMVAVIAIGIAIDGTIHLFSRYNELCRHTSDYEEAVRTTVREEATPIVATGFALALGFGVLLFSNFTVIAQFGALSAATLLFSIFVHLLITPIIMSRIRLIGLHQILTLTMQQALLEKSPLFRDMSNYQIRKAILISETHDFRRDERMIKQGSTGRSMYVLLSGRAEVLWHDGPHTRHIRYLNSGDVCGEIGFIRTIRRTTDVRAITPVSALRYDLERIRKDLRFFPRIIARINFNISCILAERLADQLNPLAVRSPDDASGNG